MEKRSKDQKIKLSREERKELKKQKKEDERFSISSTEYAALENEERAFWAPVKPKYERIPIICYILFGLAAICAIVYLISFISPEFADFFNINIGSAVRSFIATITGILPFSLAELIIILIPFIAFIMVWYFSKFRCETNRSAIVSVVCILSAAALLFSMFVVNLGVGYKGSSLDEKLGIKSGPVDSKELYSATVYLAEKINELEPEIYYDAENFSIMPYDFATLNEKLLEAYDKFAADHYFIKNFKSRLKPVMLSEPMSYTHITGVYTFFTGESNINVNFPDYTLPFTAAHELAHQRGIAREDEANMIAFLVCIGSDDLYIRYSAYMNMYEYFSSALYRADKALYKKAARNLIIDAQNEMIAYGDFFEKYERSVASKVSGTVNDVYLKTQGTAGRQSYGMVVDLTVAYLKNESLIKSEQK